LEQLGPFSSLTSVGALYLAVDNSLESLDGLSTLTAVTDGNVILGHSDPCHLYGISSLITNLHGLEGITELTNLTIYGLINVTTLNGLHNLTSVQNLKVAGNGFASFESLTALKTVGDLEIGWKGDMEYGEYVGGNLTNRGLNDRSLDEPYPWSDATRAHSARTNPY
jgi:hypothetical protein